MKKLEQSQKLQQGLDCIQGQKLSLILWPGAGPKADMETGEGARAGFSVGVVFSGDHSSQSWQVRKQPMSLWVKGKRIHGLCL